MNTFMQFQAGWLIALNKKSSMDIISIVPARYLVIIIQNKSKCPLITMAESACYHFFQIFRIFLLAYQIFTSQLYSNNFLSYFIPKGVSFEVEIGVQVFCNDFKQTNYRSVTSYYTKAHRHPLTHLGAIKSESLYVNRDFGNQPLKGGTVIASREA